MKNSGKLHSHNIKQKNHHNRNGSDGMKDRRTNSDWIKKIDQAKFKRSDLDKYDMIDLYNPKFD